MRKIITLLLVCFGLTSLYSQEESQQFTYKFFWEKREPNPQLDDFLKTDGDTIEFVYTQQNELAYFEPRLKIDNSQDGKLDFSNIFIKSHGLFYYDFESQIFQNQKESLQQLLIIDLKPEDYNWEISDEILDCLSYKCKKASFTRIEKGVKQDRAYTITVWYDENYRHTIAPFGLLGLKGLIVKIDFNGGPKVHLFDISNSKKPKKIKPFTKGKRVSLSEFNQMIDDYMLKLRERTQNKVDKD